MKNRFNFLMNEAVEGGDTGGGMDLNVNDGNQGTFTSSVPITDNSSSSEAVDNAGFLNSISLEHREGLKNVKDINDLASQYINSQKLIGKKTIGELPQDATDEQWSEHYSKIRPESADKYEFSNEGLGEDFERNEDEATAVKELMHKAGLSQRQVSILQPGFDKMAQENNQPMSEEQQEESFEEIGKEAFGANYESILQKAESISADMIPDSVKNLVHEADNNTLLLLAGVLSSVQDKYGSEDTIAHDTGGVNFSDVAGRRVESNRLQSLPEFKNTLHPNHDKVLKEWNALYGR